MKWGSRRREGVGEPAKTAQLSLDSDLEPDSDLDPDLELEPDLELDVDPELDAPLPPNRRFSRAGTPKLQSLPLRLALGGAVVFVVGLLITAGAKSYRDLQIVRQREAELAVRIAASEERLEDLRHRLELLRDDPATLERLAREELGLVGKDDIVFVLPPSESTPPAAPAAP